MTASVFLAWLIGPVWLLVGLSVLLNPGFYKDMISEFFEDRLMYLFSGIMSLVAGIAIVLVHNIWATDWRVVITIVGWAGVIKGAVRILLPMGANKSLVSVFDNPVVLRVSGLVIAAIGAWLTWNAWQLS